MSLQIAIVQCPKEPNVELAAGNFSGTLTAQCCPACKGAWISAESYRRWQQEQGISLEAEPRVDVLPSQMAQQYALSPLDNRAGLCPECRHYLVRGRVDLGDQMFFVERCPNCKGYWCDRGEWPILQALRLDTRLDNIFSDTWQGLVKEAELTRRQRQATIEKLGPDIAGKIFELADLLENHPNGDFGVAYLMRRFEES